MVSKEAQAVIDMLFQSKNAGNGGQPQDMGEAMVKARGFVDQLLGALPLAKGISVGDKVEEDHFKGEWLRYDVKDMERSDHVLLFIHGGGFSNGTVLSRRFLCAKIASASKMDAFSLDYSQWPEYCHPQALMDAVNAYQYLLKKYPAEKIHVFGESAGAHLSLTLGLYLKDHGIDLPESICVNSPVIINGPQAFELLPSHTERIEREPMITEDPENPTIPYFMNADAKDPYVSPYYGDFRGFSRLFVVYGSEEILHDDSTKLVELAEEAGVHVSSKEYEGLFHVFGMFDIPETDILAADVAAFFQKR